MDPLFIDIGDTVSDSGVGPGTVTGFYKEYPMVNGKAVGRLTRTDGARFGPNGQLRLPEGIAPALIPAQVTGLFEASPKQTFTPTPAAPTPAAPVQPDQAERAAVTSRAEHPKPPATPEEPKTNLAGPPAGSVEAPHAVSMNELFSSGQPAPDIALKDQSGAATPNDELKPLDVHHDNSDDDVEGGTPLDTSVQVPAGSTGVADDSPRN